MNKLEQLNKQISYHKEQLDKLRLIKSTLKERFARKEYEQLYWSIVGKYFKLEDPFGDDDFYFKVIYTDKANSYLSTYIVNREGYKFVDTIVFDEYHQEYYRSSTSVNNVNKATEITQQEFWKYNEKYKV